MNADPRDAEGAADARPTLLIADDDTVVRAALSAQLEPHFKVVAAAGSAIDAIELAEKHRPDAALIDVDMPGGGALEAVPKIAERSPGTCMVILSADDFHPIVVELLSAGAIAYIRKGVTGEQISRTLFDALKVKAAQPPA